MNDIEYTFEGHDLTKEIVMVQGRDNPDEPWSSPKRLCMIAKDFYLPYVTADGNAGLHRYKYARLATPTIKPWTLKTAPRHLEVELRDKCLYVAIAKTETGAVFLELDDRFCKTWIELARYKQWDGTPCGEVDE
jgi:hypothetical protein